MWRLRVFKEKWQKRLYRYLLAKLYQGKTKTIRVEMRSYTLTITGYELHSSFEAQQPSPTPQGKAHDSKPDRERIR